MRIALTLAALLLSGCETRRLTVVRPDGSVATYTRTTLWGDSSTEDVSVSKDGDDFTLDVGSSGSSTAEFFLEGYGLGVGVGQRQAE